MAVSGTMSIDRDILWAGSGAIASQRGSDTWGANYVFNREGLQQDIYLISAYNRAGAAKNISIQVQYYEENV